MNNNNLNLEEKIAEILNGIELCVRETNNCPICDFMKRLDKAIEEMEAVKAPKPYDEPIVKETRNGIHCVLVKAGTINCGGNKTLTIEKDFWCALYPITESMWDYHTLSAYEYDNSPKNFVPKVNVSFFNAVDFAKKVGGRLLTSDEWEFAARGGLYTHGYKFSGSDDLNEVGWYGGNSGGNIHAVGGKKMNELGIYDMSGNVWEWTNTFVDFNENVDARGGSFDTILKGMCLTHKHSLALKVKYPDVGFRLAFDVEEGDNV